MLKQNDRIIVKRDIVRIEGPYAQTGEQGTIIGFFRSKTEASPDEGKWSVQVMMDNNEIKTFRLTSVEKIT